ncbi:hypothetical protein OPIT5_20060 [Opitutaceae bacterium TAV5]|nr:hypothetical protein OPIT5_20060 [Opitutaceae bacterium TAV5]
MKTGCVQEIPSAGHRAESRGVALAALAIVVLWAGVVLARHRTAEPPALAGYQRTAFAELSPVEQGLFADLRVAADEIVALGGEAGAWPEPAELAEEAALAPFAQDVAWRRRGAHVWTRIDATEGGRPRVVYYGRPADSGAAEWALVIDDGKPGIWRRQGGGAAVRAASGLAAEGWLEMVPSPE